MRTPKSTTTLALLLGMAMVSGGPVKPAAAKDWAVADVRITDASASVAGGRFRCSMKVHNLQDDRARDVTIKIILPIEVTVSTHPAGCEASTFRAGARSFTSSLTCRLGDLKVGEATSVSIEASAPLHPRSRSCGGFVWSSLPDQDPANNFRVATAP